MKEKRIFIFFIAIAWGILLVPHKAMAVTIPTSGYCGTSDNEEGVMWQYEDGVLTITGEGKMGDYSYMQGYKVPWYPYIDDITKIVVGEGITYIGDSMFYRHHYVREVELPESLQIIGRNAFMSCMRLTSIQFPVHLQRIERDAFSDCPLRRINIPGTVEELEDDSFYAIFDDAYYGAVWLEGVLDESEWYSVVQINEGTKRLTGSVFRSPSTREYRIRTIYFPESVEEVDVACLPWNLINAIYGKNDYMKQTAQKNYAVYVDATQTYDIANVYCKTNLNQNLQSEPKVTLAYAFGEDEVLLNEGIDYSISYEEDGAEGRMMITGMGCYQGTKTIPYVVHRDIASCQVELEKTEYWRTGEPIEPGITVTDQDVVLECGKDYEVRYTNNTEQGTATVSVTGIGRYIGEQKHKYEIQTKDLYELGCTLSQYTYYYDGQSHIPEVMIRDGEQILVRGRDYDYSIVENTVQPGIIYVNLYSVGHGKYTSDTPFVVSYEIKKGVIDDATEVSLSQSRYIWDGFPKNPEVSVCCNGVTLQPGRDYMAEGRDNWNVGQAYVVVTGIGNYEGQIEIPFEIIQNEMKRKCDITALTIQPIPDLTYCNRAMEPDLVIMHGEKKLEKDKDYTVTYSDNIDAGTATATVQGIGNYTGVCLVTFVIKPYDVSGLSSMLKGKDGKIYTAEYSGKAICPTTAFRLAAQYNGEIIYLYPRETQDYTCEYQKNKKVGIASIEYTFKGNYTGMVVKNFQIIPKAPKLEVTKKTSGNRVIRWKKIKNCDYYEVYRKTSQKGSFKKIAKVKKCYYEDKKAQPDKEYSYKIIACKKQKNKVYRSVSSRKVKK